MESKFALRQEGLAMGFRDYFFFLCCVGWLVLCCFVVAFFLFFLNDNASQVVWGNPEQGITLFVVGQ